MEYEIFPGITRNRRYSLIIIPILILCILVSSGAAGIAREPVPVHILAVNDFQGQITSGQTLNGIPAGSAPVLGACLRDTINRYGAENTFIALPGDITGGSPPESALLLDEPTILFWNGFVRSDWASPENAKPTGVRVIATLGNHEFDRNLIELSRLLSGGNEGTTITRPVDPYPGAFWPVTAANVYLNGSDTLYLTPYEIGYVNGIPIAFIGAITTETMEISKYENVAGIRIRDEAGSINRQIAELQHSGIHAFVVLLHEGGNQTPYDGQTRSDGDFSGKAADIVARLDGDVDVVLSAHSKEFTNQFVPNAGGNRTLVTQAYSAGKAYADISLSLDPETRDIIASSATIVPAYADRPPGSDPYPGEERLLDRVTSTVGPLMNGSITISDVPQTRDLDQSGESSLYNLVTDAFRWSMKSDIAITNIGSVRADIPSGNITTSMAYAALPFHDQVLIVSLTGRQIRDLLIQQWTRTVKPDHYLQISGFSYRYNPSLNPADRILNITINGNEIGMDTRYTVAVQDFLAYGGDGYTVMQEGEIIEYGPLDVDAFIGYLKVLPTPVHPETGGRIIPGNGS